jgi:hypothetical protein
MISVGTPFWGLGGVTLKETTLYYCDGQRRSTALGPATTNSIVWINFIVEESGDYALFFSYNDTSYALIAPTAPLDVTYVAFYVPSGIMTSCTDGLNHDCLIKG